MNQELLFSRINEILSKNQSPLVYRIEWWGIWATAK